MIEGVHPEIIVGDLDRAIRFYRDTLGLKLLFTFDDSFNGDAVGIEEKVAMRIAFLEAGEGQIELIEYVTPKGKPFHRLPNNFGTVYISLRVSNIHESYNDLQKKGVMFCSPINEVKEGAAKGWKWVFLYDPHGVLIELVEQR